MRNIREDVLIIMNFPTIKARADGVMELIVKRQAYIDAEYQELVEVADYVLREWVDPSDWNAPACKKLRKLLNKHLPPPPPLEAIADELDALGKEGNNAMTDTVMVSKSDLKSIIKKVRDLVVE